MCMQAMPFSFQVTLLLLVGAAFGSFGNVLVYRLPRGERLDGRSQCPSCNHVLGVLDLIPIISFLGLQARCRYCDKSISWQYPIVEFLSAALFVSPLLIMPLAFIDVILLAFCLWLLLLIAVIDAQIQAIPDLLNIPLLIFSALYAISTDSLDMFALAMGVGFLGLQWMVSFGHWVGSGDVILIASMALLVGSWQSMLLLILLAYIMGASVASVLLFTGKKGRKDHLAFAPFLVASTVVTLFFGPKIIELYVGAL